MRSSQIVGGLVAGSVTAAAVGLFMLPRRKRNSLMRSGRKYMAKGNRMMRISKIWQ